MLADDGLVCVAKPSSAALPAFSSSFSFPDLRLRKVGVGVARRARTLPATGSSCRPRLKTLPLLDVSDVATLETSLSESIVLSPVSPPSYPPSVTAPTAFSTLSFHDLIRSMSLAFDGDGNRKNSWYRLSRLTSMSSNTLLHFLMTSRKPLKVVSSLSTPRVAVSTATSSTKAKRKSMLPMNSHKTMRALNSAGVRSSAPSSPSSFGLAGVCPTAA
mmetsp:Transcript_12946/g.37544  ORF Transcript_12946/g.37544 Transcript_12946/m.37544 type:complete len:216 (-) Transcript_12946:919-1566(-)